MNPFQLSSWSRSIGNAATRAAIVIALIDIILRSDWDWTLGNFRVHSAAPEVVNVLYNSVVACKHNDDCSCMSWKCFSRLQVFHMFFLRLYYCCWVSIDFQRNYSCYYTDFGHLTAHQLPITIFKFDVLWLLFARKSELEHVIRTIPHFNHRFIVL